MQAAYTIYTGLDGYWLVHTGMIQAWTFGRRLYFCAATITANEGSTCKYGEVVFALIVVAESDRAWGCGLWIERARGTTRTKSSAHRTCCGGELPHVAADGIQELWVRTFFFSFTNETTAKKNRKKDHGYGEYCDSTVYKISEPSVLGSGRN